ncbi:Protein-export membrane protein SecF [uncultured archaeon]|nr:Protein-export membrane protein SecF [uncultured archaeon]
MIKEALLKIYDVHYRKLMIFSFILLLICISSLFIVYARTGEFFQKGVSLKGGITMTIPVDYPIDIKQIETSLLNKYPQADISVREITQGGAVSAITIEASDVTSADLEQTLPELGVKLEKGKYSIESMGSSLGQRFFTQIIKALIMAFICMSIVVFITFRSIVPSMFVILTAASDILSTLAVTSIIGMKMSTAGIAALLMLIGYSVDTDILLTTKVLKRKGEGGTVFERTVGALRTGLTMTATALVAGIIGLFFTQSQTIRDIMLITVIGLCFDLVYTWFQNAGILRWYMERKDGRT